MPKTGGIHGRDHRLIGNDPVPVVLHVKVFKDTTAVAVGNGARTFWITQDMNGCRLIDAQAGVSTVSSSGAVTAQVRNVTQGVNLLTTAVTINAGQFSSYAAGTTAAVPNLVVCAVGDMITIDVSAAGSGAKGLEMILTFGIHAG